MKVLTFLFLFMTPIAQATTTTPSPGFVDSPAQCFAKKSYPCGLRVTDEFLAFERESQKYHLAEKSSVLFLAASHIQILQGKIWVQDSKDLQVKVSSALQMRISGEWFLEKQMDTSLLARNLSGEALFESKFVFKNETLPVGFQNWFGPVDSTGQVSRGMIRPIAMTEFLKAWLPLTGLSIAEAKHRTQSYKQAWIGTVEQSAILYRKIVERRIASQQAKAQKLAAQKASRALEQSQLKKLYREKNGI